MIDINARNKLQSMQTTKAIEELTSAIKEQEKTNGSEEIKTLTISLLKLAKSLDSFDISENFLEQLKTLSIDLSTMSKILAKNNLAQSTNGLTEKNDVGTAETPPSIEVTNLHEIGKTMGVFFTDLQQEIAKALEKNKTQLPKSVNVGNEVKISEFSSLLDGIEELKKGFNILINKEAATLGFPSSSIPVEIQNWMIPQPVTNININALQGFAKTTKTTVGTGLT